MSPRTASWAQVYSREVETSKLDVYPDAGEFTTCAMGEGAIQGRAEEYEVAGLFAQCTVPAISHHNFV